MVSTGDNEGIGAGLKAVLLLRFLVVLDGAMDLRVIEV